MTNVFIVASVGTTESIASTKEPGKNINRRTIVLREFGGQYADSFVCNCLGDDATVQLVPGQLVAAYMRFTATEYNGRFYQDCLCRELRVIK